MARIVVLGAGLGGTLMAYELKDRLRGEGAEGHRDEAHHEAPDEAALVLLGGPRGLPDAIVVVRSFQ